MLIACKECHRQYDVGAMKPGEHVRCLCGELVEVPRFRPRTARAIHCSSCGGKIRERATECEYCGNTISTHDRDLGPACPECFARLRKNARFCRDCGVEIRPETIQARRLDSQCPRCQGKLVHCTIQEGQYTECSACGGLWLEEDFFGKVVEEKDASIEGKITPGGRKKESGPEVTQHDVKYLPCPICGNFMHRKNFAGCSGIVIDWCKGHGFWFDTHELEKVVAFVRSGGMDKARAREISRARRQREMEEKRRRRPATFTSSSASSASVHTPSGFNTRTGAQGGPFFGALEVLGSFMEGLFDW